MAVGVTEVMKGYRQKRHNQHWRLLGRNEDITRFGKFSGKMEERKVKVRYLLVGLVITSLFVCLSSIGRAAQDPDLVFYMSFDNVSGNEIEDDSGNGSTGTLNGDAG